MEGVTDIPQASAQTQTVQRGPLLTSYAHYADEPCIVVEAQNPSVQSASRQSPLEIDNGASSQEGWHVNTTTIVTACDTQIGSIFGHMDRGGIDVKDQNSAVLVPLLSARDGQVPDSDGQSTTTDKVRCGLGPIPSPLPSTTSETHAKENSLVDTRHTSEVIDRRGQSLLTEHQDDPREIHTEDDTNPYDDFPSSSLPPSSSPVQLFSSSPFCSSQSSVTHFENQGGDDGRVFARETDITSPGSTVPEAEQTDLLQQLQDGCLPLPTGEIMVNSRTIAEDDALDNVGLDPDKGDVAPHHSTPTHLGKRPLIRDTFGSEPNVNVNSVQRLDDAEYPSLSKRPKTRIEVYSPPAPRRSTLAAQRSQYRKLIAPFRSPLRLAVGNVTQMARREKKLSQESSTEFTQRQHEIPPPTCPEIKPATLATARTSKAAAQFKSPMLGSGAPTDSRCTFRLTPAIQTLERKLQLLKRAVKIKEDNEEEILSRLAKKWTDAGREVAYELWDLVKEGTFPNKAPSFGRSWGWDTADPGAEDGDAKLLETDLGSLRTERLNFDDDNSGPPTLATMLRDHGIAAETLGWDDEMETFLD